MGWLRDYITVVQTDSVVDFEFVSIYFNFMGWLRDYITVVQTDSVVDFEFVSIHFNLWVD